MIRSMKMWKKNMASSSNSSSMNSWLSSNSDEDPLPDVSFLTNYSLLDFLKTKLEPDEEIKPQPSSTNKSPFIVRIEVNPSEQSSNMSDLHSDEITIEDVPNDCCDMELLSDGEEKPNADSSEVVLSSSESKVQEMVPKKEIKNDPHSGDEDTKYQNNHSYCMKEMPDEKCVPSKIKKEPSSSSFECEICHKTYSKLSYLVCHIRIHSRPKPFKCDICDRKFPWMSRMVNHKKKVHSGEKPYKCRICNQSFNDKYNMTRHEGNHSKRFQCDLCDESFSLRSDWLQHRRNNHVELYICEVCGRAFSQKSKLACHKKMMHNSDGDSKCEFCDETFHDGLSLLEHKRMRHMNDGKFKCQVCKRGFSNLWSLRKHAAARHTVGFAYACDLCDRTFYEQGYLMNHRRCHLPKSPSK